MNYTLEEIVNELDTNLQLNANRIPCSQCYATCANKSKLDLLLKDENQVIMGRRGTGKTTLFKAFTFYVNKVVNDPQKKAWYISLDECVPSDTELEENSLDDVIVCILKKFLDQLLQFLYHNLEKLEKERSEILRRRNIVALDFHKKVDKIIDLIFKLESLVEGSPQKKDDITNVEEEKEKSSAFNLGVDTEKKPAFLGRYNRAKATKTVIHNSKKYIFKLNILEIRNTIIEIFQEFEYQKVYICLDEFNLIDRRTTTSLQSRLAQLIKELFFGSSLFVVKIANVWNESRMQRRNGAREGLELGHDIFLNHDLDLDTMFEHDNQIAYSFFVELIVNNFLLQKEFENETEKNYVTSIEFKSKLIEYMFAKDALKCLVCGSQGVPRIFGEILGECLKEVKKDNYQKKISVEKVCKGIIKNYNTNIRKAIPYDSVLYSAIDDYLDKHLNRFFLVEIDNYNKGKKYFDGLVATNALHQCPTEQLPRKMKNKFKVYFVHYGNYLEAVGNQLKKVATDAKTDSLLLYPEFPENLETNIQDYLLNVPDNAFDYLYCDDCHQYFERDMSNKSVYVTCPECNKIISYWR